MCQKRSIVGLGTKDRVVTHGIRGPVTTRPFEANRAETAIMHRNGHKNISTLRRYQNLMGDESKIQQNPAKSNIRRKR